MRISAQLLGLRAAWSASHALAGTIENNEAGRCPEAPRLPRECQPDTEHGSNIWLLHSGLRPERLKHATEEFRRIGWRFKRVGPSGDDAHGCLAARFPYWSGNAGTKATSSGGHHQPVNFAHLSMIDHLANSRSLECAFIFEDDVKFHHNFSSLFARYWPQRRVKRVAIWQLGAFTNGLKDHPRDGQSGWAAGFGPGTHAYVVTKSFARIASMLAQAEPAPLRSGRNMAPLSIDLWLRHRFGHLSQKLVDGPPVGNASGNQMGIAFQRLKWTGCCWRAR